MPLGLVCSQNVFCLVLGIQGTRRIFGGIVHEFQIYSQGVLRWLSALIKCLCMAPLTPLVMVIRGLIVHAMSHSVHNNGLYLYCFHGL